MSHYGKEFSDSPFEIFKFLSKEKNKLEHIIVLNETANQIEFWKSGIDIKFVRFGSFKYYYYCATAKIWIFNVTTSEFMKPKKQTFYLQTWHGIPLKKIGNDIVDEKLSFEKKRWIASAKYWDMFLSPSPFFNPFFQSAFKIESSIIRSQGLPREDFFISEVSQKKSNLNKKFSFEEKKINVLYAPTFRSNKMNGFPYPINISKLSEELGNEYRILVKLHPNIQTEETYESNNVFYYKSTVDINDLLLVTDILITDYSSIFFDFSLLKNAMIFFAFDLKNYELEERGFYFDYQKFVPGPIVSSQKELFEAIKKMEWNDKKYQKKYSFLLDIMNQKEISTPSLCDFLLENVLKI